MTDLSKNVSEIGTEVGNVFTKIKTDVKPLLKTTYFDRSAA